MALKNQEKVLTTKKSEHIFNRIPSNELMDRVLDNIINKDIKGHELKREIAEYWQMEIDVQNLSNFLEFIENWEIGLKQLPAQTGIQLKAKI